ncbi:MAG: hypothetical protein KIT60_03935 [Burkholderiaceae bacterium]|nr:hypothetical protein [Burkholderiaceae bacterium]
MTTSMRCPAALVAVLREPDAPEASRRFVEGAMARHRQLSQEAGLTPDRP